MRARESFALALWLGACAAPERSDSTTTPAGPQATQAAQESTWARIPDAPRVGRYVSSAWGFSTVSYWIEGDDGVVLVDTQFLPSGLSDAWLQRVEELQALQPTHVHPGRGSSGGPELLVAQGEYLRRVQALVSKEHAALTEGGATPSDDDVKAALARVRATLEHEYPEHRFAVFLAIGLPAEWRRVASGKPAA